MISAANDLSPIFVWSLILIAAVVGGFVLVALLKRRLTTPDQPATIGFSLEDLRSLHRQGKLSAEEYERARARLAAGLKQAIEPSPAGKKDVKGSGRAD